MSVRQLENPWVGSNFSEFYRIHVPSNRTLTDIDDFVFDDLLPARIIEARSKKYVPPVIDRALSTLKSFARFLGVDFQKIAKIEDRRHDLQHCVFVADQNSRYQLFVVYGNRSDLRGPDYYTYDERKWEALSSLAQSKGLRPRVIRLNREGHPQRDEDKQWLIRLG